MTRTPDWPVCLILTGTMEAETLFNYDKTLTRRSRPIEIPPLQIEAEGRIIVNTVTKMVADMGMSDAGLLEDAAFQRRWFHAAAARFGVAVELAIEAAHGMGEDLIMIDRFADAYHARSDADDELNPFISDNWKGIDATKLLDRKDEDTPPPKKRTKMQI